MLLGGMQAGPSQGDDAKLGWLRWVKKSEATREMEVLREVVH